MTLLVFYDSDFKDKGRDSYLKAISSKIPDARLVDTCKGKKFDQDVYAERDRFLILEPFDDNIKSKLVTIFKDYPQLDIEGVYTDKLTITAEAILETIWSEQGNDLRGKTVVIINQSGLLGRPLAKELVDLSVNVISLNSSYPCLDNLLTMTDIDILVSASGKYEFKIDRELTRFIDVKIDLSDDLEDPVKITSIPTVDVLKDRL